MKRWNEKADEVKVQLERLLNRSQELVGFLDAQLSVLKQELLPDCFKKANSVPPPQSLIPGAPSPSPSLPLSLHVAIPPLMHVM